MLKYIGLSLVILVVISSCSDAPLDKKNEIVMCDGMSIEVYRGEAAITISAYSSIGRKYVSENIDEKFDLIPRDKRWDGSMGLYRPTGNNGIHVVLEEGHQYFSSQDEALEWLKWQGSRLGYVYTSNGLVVGWSIERDKSNNKNVALLAQVWQFYINGQKPTALPGSNDGAIKINESVNCEKMNKSSGFNSEKQKTIKGRLYSGKSIDYMTEKRISPDIVEMAIKNGQSYMHNDFVGYNYDTSDGRFIWVLMDKNGRVVLVG